MVSGSPSRSRRLCVIVKLLSRVDLCVYVSGGADSEHVSVDEKKLVAV